MAARILFLCLLFLSACTPSTPESRFSDERQKLTHRALKKFIVAMQEKGLTPAGIGEGINHRNNKQNCLEVVFDIDELPSVEFARELIVEALQQFLHTINYTYGIEEYLSEYPFPLKFIQVAILGRNETGLCAVWNREEMLMYDKHQPGESFNRKTVCEETYDEALKILAQQKHSAVRPSLSL